MSRIRGGKVIENVHHTVEQHKPKISKSHKGFQTALILLGIFFVVMFLTCYFNYQSGIMYNPSGTTVGTKFFLAGPDPYLNMRQAELTLQTGTYPFTLPHNGNDDPLLNYPVGGRGSRPPLFTMVAVGSATLLKNFMSSVDALGWSMLFLPAIYGALLVFPVYGIGKTLFNRKVGIFSALFVALMPVHIGGSHGASLGLFDHDSFILLLFAFLFFFIIKMLKEKNRTKSLLYGMLSGLMVSSLYLAWDASQEAYMLPLVGMFVIMIFDIFKSRTDLKNYLSFVLLFVVAYVVAIPYAIIQGQLFDLPFISLIGAMAIFGMFFILARYKVPWIVSIPTLASIAAVGSAILYLSTLGIIKLNGFLSQLAINVFGEGIYGSKVSMTVAEAHTFSISQNVMSFGPVLYWLALGGFVLYIIKTYKEKWKAENLFFIFVFVFDFYLTTVSGRFLNDMVTTMVIFTGFFTCLIMDRVDLKQMVRNMSHLTGFDKRKAIKWYHYAGIVFVVIGLILPNAILVIDAAVPGEAKSKYFNANWTGAFGTSVSKEIYWADAFYWLSQQDKNITQDKDKPAFISWWDYGFYEAAQGKHPTVADNYQVGMYASGNFKLATTENEAVSVLIVRCCEGVKAHNNGKLTEAVKSVFNASMPLIYEYQINKSDSTIHRTSYLPNNVSFYNLSTIKSADLLTQYIEDPTSCPTYNTLDSPQYGNTVFRKRADNAMYQDSWSLMQNMTDEQMTTFYKAIQNATHYSIRYYGTEQYDTQIFGVFTFLTDRGYEGFGPGLYEDDYYVAKWQDTKTGETYFAYQLDKYNEQEIQNMSLQEVLDKKPLLYQTMWYKTYYGYGDFPDKRLPTYMLEHFKLAYYSPVVVISKYYEDATIKGTVKVGDHAFPYVFVYVFDEYGVPHANGMTDENGNYTLLVPAGNLTLGVYTTQNNLNITKPIHITEAEGTRQVPCNKTVDFQMNYSAVNLSVITNRYGLTLNIDGQEYQQTLSYPVNGNQSYAITNLIPQTYKFTVMSGNNTLFNSTKFLKPGDNVFNVTVPSGP